MNTAEKGITKKLHLLGFFQCWYALSEVYTPLYHSPLCFVELLAGKTSLMTPIFQLSYSSRRKRFVLLKHVFIRVRKMRLVFSFLSLWDKVGNGEEEMEIMTGSLRGSSLQQWASQWCALHSPDFWKASNDKRPELQTHRHHPSIPLGQQDHRAQCQHAADLWERTLLGAHLSPPLLCGCHINPSLLVKAVGFDSSSPSTPPKRMAGRWWHSENKVH